MYLICLPFSKLEFEKLPKVKYLQINLIHRITVSVVYSPYLVKHHKYYSYSENQFVILIVLKLPTVTFTYDWLLLKKSIHTHYNHFTVLRDLYRIKSYDLLTRDLFFFFKSACFSVFYTYYISLISYKKRKEHLSKRTIHQQHVARYLT